MTMRHLLPALCACLTASFACGSKDAAPTATRPTASAAAAHAPLRTSVSWPGYRLERTLGRSGDGAGELKTPMGLDVNAAGEIVVADTGNARMELLSAQGEQLWSYAGEGEEALGRPMDVAFAPDGSLWVADFERDALVHLAGSGTLIERRVGDASPKSPAGVIVLPDGRLVVSSFYDHALRVYGGQGSAGTIGTEGDSEGQFHYPTGMTLDATGRLWVADSYNHRVQRFDANFEYETSLHGSDTNKLEVPVGVAWLDGVLHIADSGHHRVVALDPVTGLILSEWRVPGTREIHTPSRIVASGERLYVTDPAGDRIYVLRKAE